MTGSVSALFRIGYQLGACFVSTRISAFIRQGRSGSALPGHPGWATWAVRLGSGSGSKSLASSRSDSDIPPPWPRHSESAESHGPKSWGRERYRRAARVTGAGSGPNHSCQSLGSLRSPGLRVATGRMARRLPPPTAQHRRRRRCRVPPPPTAQIYPARIARRRPGRPRRSAGSPANHSDPPGPGEQSLGRLLGLGPGPGGSPAGHPQQPPSD